jgi:hypothetical protein
MSWARHRRPINVDDVRIYNYKKKKQDIGKTRTREKEKKKEREWERKKEGDEEGDREGGI